MEVLESEPLEGDPVDLPGAGQGQLRHEDDVARVGTFGRDVELSRTFTHDQRELQASLPSAIAPDAPTPLWRGIDEAIAAFADGGSERPVIVVLSDGKDTSSLMARHPVSQAEVIERARRADVSSGR